MIVAIGLSSLAGCSSTRVTDGVTDSAECEVQSRPEPSSDPELDGKSYPNFPDTFSESSLMDYSQEFERAYIWNWILSQSYDTTNVNVRYPRGSSVKLSDGTGTFQSYVRVTYATKSGDSDEPVQGDMKYDVTYKMTEYQTQRKSEEGGSSTYTVVNCHE